MKAYYYGSPSFAFIKWAFAIKRRWAWARFIVIVPVALQLSILLPLAWACVKVGKFGHWLAYGCGHDSREGWDD